MGQLGTFRGFFWGVLMYEGGDGGRTRWVDVILASIAAVSWSLVAMAAVAALGLHLLGADAADTGHWVGATGPAGRSGEVGLGPLGVGRSGEGAAGALGSGEVGLGPLGVGRSGVGRSGEDAAGALGSGEVGLGPLTAAVVALGVGGSVTPWGGVSALGVEGAVAESALDVTPLGVGLTGALVLSYVFLRSLRAAAGPAYVSGGELAARAGVLAALFVAAVGGLVWLGQDVIAVGGDSLLPVEASVGYRLNAVDSLAGALLWVAGVLVLALFASPRAPLPPGRGWDAVRRVVRPGASALVTAAVVAVAAGWAVAGWAAVGDGHPGRVVGAALLGAPNGVWLGVALGLFVPWEGRASGGLAGVVPEPLAELLRVSSGETVTVARLAGMERGVWLLVVAAGLLMLGAGVLSAVRTARGGLGAVAFAGRCAVRLGAVAAVGLPLAVWSVGGSADASLSVWGAGVEGVGAVDGLGAVDGSVELRGDGAVALLLGAGWGVAAGAAGALLAHGAGVAGRGAWLPPAPRAVPLPWWGPGAPGVAGPYRPSVPYRPPNPDTNPYLRLPDPGAPPEGWGDGRPEREPPGG